MGKLNCWEFMKCERVSSGVKAGELGVCPAAVEIRTNGINGGLNAGRACWVIPETLADGKVQGNFIFKMNRCMNCKFFLSVTTEEGHALVSSKEIYAKIQ